MTIPPISLCRFHNETDKKPKPVTLEWGGVCGLLTRRIVRERKEGTPAFSPAVYRPGTLRAKANVQSVTALAADFDGTTTPDAVTDVLSQRGLAAVVYSSHSHPTEDGRAKFRVLIPFTVPVSAEEWHDGTAARLLVGLFGTWADASCVDASRLFYLPSCHPAREADAFAFTLEGNALDPATVAEPDPECIAAWHAHYGKGRAEQRTQVDRAHWGGKVGPQGTRPGDDYNARAAGETWELLKAAGWHGDEMYPTRPGKSGGGSASLGYLSGLNGEPLFHVFTPNALPFKANATYDPFAVRTLLRHGGDFKAAAKALAAEGYGTQTERKAKRPVPATRAGQAPNQTDAPPASEEPDAAPGGEGEAHGAKAEDAPKERKPPALERLVAVLEAEQHAGRLELCLTDRDEMYARLPTGKGGQTVPVKSRRFRAYLVQLHRAANEGKMPPTQAVEDALRYLEAVLYERADTRRRLCVRVAPEDPNAPPEKDPRELWYDPCDPTGQAIRITAAGWTIEADSGFRFRRHAPQAPQVEPVRGGNLSDLRPLLNLPDIEPTEPTGKGSNPGWVLLVAWMVAAFFPDIAHPILVVHGRQGSAKSTLVRLPARLIDPSHTELRSQPENKPEWIQQADHAYLIALDNLSVIPKWFSDPLCTAVTGEGFSKRMLFTDAEDVIISFRRLVALTGIEVPTQEPDVLERSILLGLEPIAPEARKLETAVLAEFERRRPALFGSLLDTVAATLRELPAIDPENLPRMADFARVGLAVERAMGWPAGAFTAAYDANVEGQNTEALAASPLTDALLTFKTECAADFDKREKEPGYRPPHGDVSQTLEGLEWRGTPANLYTALTERWQGRPPKGFPAAANKLTGALKRLAPNLPAVGIHADTGGKSNGRRLVTLLFTPPGEPKGEDRPEPARRGATPTPPKAPTAPTNCPAGSVKTPQTGSVLAPAGPVNSPHNGGFERGRGDKGDRAGTSPYLHYDPKSDAETDLEDPFAGDDDFFGRDPFSDEEGGMP